MIHTFLTSLALCDPNFRGHATVSWVTVCMRDPGRASAMNTSTILKLSLLVGAALLVGLHLPSPWRATPGQPWEVDSTLAAGGGSHDGRHHDLQKQKAKRVEVDVYGEVGAACRKATS